MTSKRAEAIFRTAKCMLVKGPSCSGVTAVESVAFSFVSYPSPCLPDPFNVKLVDKTIVLPSVVFYSGKLLIKLAFLLGEITSYNL